MTGTSIATIQGPEFIHLQKNEINPLMDSCEIKVMYIGQNRNGSYITKEVATEMSKSLRGAPIVGMWREDKQDFGDHGDEVVFDVDGIHFNCLTRPYGFVSPDAEVWFQNFDDTDEFGNTVTREYLMTTGYLWTGQFEEAKRVIEKGNGQSMELDENSMDGHWANDPKTGYDFFIINDATFSKLCILGDDVEPCFEGASVTAPNVSTTFSRVADNNFKQTLYNMMQDLKFALQGGQMEENQVIEPVVTEEVPTATPQVENFEVSQDNIDQNTSPVVDNSVEENSSFASTEDKKDEDEDENKEPESKDKEDEEKKPETKSALVEDNHELEELQAKYSKLESDYNELNSKYEALVEYKKNIEDKQKDELIATFDMLADEDKAEVIENKSNYSLEDIESKLAVICYRKGVNFTSNKETKAESNFTLDINNNDDVLPDWVKAVEEASNI